jgi:phosphatidylserine/phosphatidylglycerophosphate/cardiolipin synthase-like enzyme
MPIQDLARGCRVMTKDFAAKAARLLWLALALALIPIQAARAQFGIPGFELVHTYPVETSLETPDLRDPVTVWCEMFDRAKHSIDLEQFYVSGMPGEPLDRVIASLEAAGKRGVHIRFLMEEKGQSASDTPTIDRLKAIPNLEFRMLGWAKVNGSGIIHAKFFVVDGRSAFVGSQNFDWRALKHIDETGLAITHPRIVGQLHRIFAHDWNAAALVAAGKPVPPLRKTNYAPIDAKAFLVASPNAYDPSDVGDSQASLVKLIGAARRDIRIEVMEYSASAFGGGTYTVIDDALRAAAARGVHIKLAIADWNMWPSNLPALESLAALPNVEIRVAAIPPASTGFIPFARVVHTKIMAIDGEVAWVGTSNWEGGYLDNSRNLEIVLRDRKMAERVGGIQMQLWNSRYTLPFALAKAIPRPKTKAD